MIYHVSPLGPSGVWTRVLRIKSPASFQSATATIVLQGQFILLVSVHITFPKLTHETRFSCTFAHHKSSYDTFLMNTPFVNKSSWVIHWFSSWFIILSWMIVNCSLARSAVSCKTTYERPRVQQRHTSLTSFNKFDNTPGNKSTPTSSCRRIGVANIDATEKSRF